MHRYYAGSAYPREREREKVREREWMLCAASAQAACSYTA